MELQPSAPPEERDAATLTVLLDRASGDIARGLALGQLGITDDTQVRMLMSTGPGAAVERFTGMIAGQHRIIARDQHEGETVLLLAAGDAGPITVRGIPVHVRAAYSRVVPAARTHEAFGNARDAHLFARPSPHDLGPYQPIDSVLVDGSRLAGLSALCRLTPEDISSVPEIGILELLSAHHGEDIVRVLEAYAIAGSLRKAAAQVFMHHNSLAYWLEKAEAAFGYPLTEPNRRAQLFITVCLYRLWTQRERLRCTSEGLSDERLWRR